MASQNWISATATTIPAARGNEREVIEQLAAGDAGAQINPADDGAEQHRDRGGDGRQAEAVQDRALGDVVLEQDELVVRERQALPEIQPQDFENDTAIKVE
jgi:hypothetical protein